MAGEFGPDGTQALPPLPVYPDSLSGLVSGFVEDVPETQPPALVPPPAVNQEAVRDAAKAVLAKDKRRRPIPAPAPPRQPTPVAPAAPGGGNQSSAAGVVGCLVVLVFAAIIFLVVVLGTGR
jgi:hypothetical protein